VILAAPDREKFLMVVDASLKVGRRHQFFNWAHGTMQTLLPHEILVCALRMPLSNSFKIDCFSSVPLDVAGKNFLMKAEGGLIPNLVSIWQQGHRLPVLYPRKPATGVDLSMLMPEFARLPFSNLLAHGACDSAGEPSSFFCLLGVPETLAARQIYLLRVLTPYLHTAWMRAHVDLPCEPAAKKSRPGKSVLTARQFEVVQWVHEGKSNHEISLILEISPLTVKTHVQRILRKLNVCNRTQAAAKSLALRPPPCQTRPGGSGSGR
jgi:transcriptional regulator EpsA